MNELSKRLKSALEAPTFIGSRKRTSFYPSSTSVEVSTPLGPSVIGTCLRQQYYDFTEEPISNIGETDYRISAIIGDKISEMVVQFIDEHGYKMGLQRLAVESSFYDPRINLSGRCDIIAWDSIKREVIGLEIKSVGEFKANKTMLLPDEQHIMQAAIYLDYYKTYMASNQQLPKKWYIWYCSRTENYSIKAKKHSSPLQMLWDFHITLDDDGVPTVHSPNGKTRMEHLKLEKIHERYKKLADYIETKTLPPRDFEIKYSPEKITSMYQLDLLTRKADKEVVEKWLKKGAPQGKLKLEMGDFSCNLCAWKDKCWGLISQQSIPKTISNLPAKTEEQKNNNPSW